MIDKVGWCSICGKLKETLNERGYCKECREKTVFTEYKNDTK